jgi:hypothetical protein
MTGPRLIEELDELHASQEKLFLIRKEVKSELDEKLDIYKAPDNRRPRVIVETFAQHVSDNWQVSLRDAYKVLQDIVRDSNGLVFYESGVLLGPKNWLVKCSLGHRYSTALKTCPDPMHRINP